METVNAVLELLLRPFVAWMLLAALIGQVTKTQLFTRERANDLKIKCHWFWRWGRKTLALHGAAVGILIGLFWPGEIESGYSGGTIQGVMYFAGAGGLAVWGFEVVKGLAKKRGITLGEVGGSKPPEPPKE